MGQKSESLSFGFGSMGRMIGKQQRTVNMKMNSYLRTKCGCKNFHTHDLK